MLKLKIEFIFLAITLLLSGCVGHFAMASRLNDIGPGMTEAEVITFMGLPERTETGNGYKNLTYILNADAWDDRMPEPYVIHLINGKVDRFGTKKEMEQFEQGVNNGDKAQKLNIVTEITELDELRKKGLITDKEFSDQKAKLLDRI
jgi:hypothetical protein